MELNFVEKLPKQQTAIHRANSMRADVLEELVEALAGQAGDWAVYPWRLVRPDLDTEAPNRKKVKSHLAAVQGMCKRSEAPFDEYLFEFTVRGLEGYIRVALDPRTNRDLY